MWCVRKRFTFRQRNSSGAEIAEHASDEAITPREIDVLRLIARGNANKIIAAELSLTEETVKSHIRNILSKLGLTTGPTPSL